MKYVFRRSAKRNFSARAFSLAEAAISILIVSVMLVAALNTLGASRVGESQIADRSRGLLLAQDLMTEILQQEYEDPDLSAGSFGIGFDEVGDGSRMRWDDVDDYDGWSASPPETQDGVVIPGYDDWQRSVIVEWVNPMDLQTVMVGDSGVKRITVIADHSRRATVKLRAYRTTVWQSPILLKLVVSSP